MAAIDSHICGTGLLSAHADEAPRTSAQVGGALCFLRGPAPEAQSAEECSTSGGAGGAEEGSAKGGASGSTSSPAQAATEIRRKQAEAVRQQSAPPASSAASGGGDASLARAPHLLGEVEKERLILIGAADIGPWCTADTDLLEELSHVVNCALKARTPAPAPCCLAHIPSRSFRTAVHRAPNGAPI